MSGPRTLAIDIGGTGVKAALLDEAGHLLGERHRVPTPPKPVKPDDLLQAIDRVVAPIGEFDRVSVGFATSCVVVSIRAPRSLAGRCKHPF